MSKIVITVLIPMLPLCSGTNAATKAHVKFTVSADNKVLSCHESLYQNQMLRANQQIAESRSCRFCLKEVRTLQLDDTLRMKACRIAAESRPSLPYREDMRHVHARMS